MSKNVSPPWTNYEDLKSWFVAHGRNKGQTQEFIEKTLEDDPRINAHHFLVFLLPSSQRTTTMSLSGSVRNFSRLNFKRENSKRKWNPCRVSAEF